MFILFLPKVYNTRILILIWKISKCYSFYFRYDGGRLCKTDILSMPRKTYRALFIRIKWRTAGVQDLHKLTFWTHTTPPYPGRRIVDSCKHTPGFGWIIYIIITMCIESVITFTYIGRRRRVSVGRVVKYALVEFQDYQPSFRYALPLPLCRGGINLAEIKYCYCSVSRVPVAETIGQDQMFINKPRSCTTGEVCSDLMKFLISCTANKILIYFVCSA